MKDEKWLREEDRPARSRAATAIFYQSSNFEFGTGEASAPDAESCVVKSSIPHPTMAPPRHDVSGAVLAKGNPSVCLTELLQTRSGLSKGLAHQIGLALDKRPRRPRRLLAGLRALKQSYRYGQHSKVTIESVITF